MNPFDLPLNLADSPLIGMLVGLLLWTIAAAFVILVVELVSFLWLTIHAMRSSRLTAAKALARKP